MDKQAISIETCSLGWRDPGGRHASVLLGLGLGEITLNSYLNEPLAAEVELLDVRPHRRRCAGGLATQEAFDRLGVDRAYFLTSINFEVVIEGGVAAKPPAGTLFGFSG